MDGTVSLARNGFSRPLPRRESVDQAEGRTSSPAIEARGRRVHAAKIPKWKLDLYYRNGHEAGRN
jgi:hypothetical protein